MDNFVTLKIVLFVIQCRQQWLWEQNPRSIFESNIPDSPDSVHVHSDICFFLKCLKFISSRLKVTLGEHVYSSPVGIIENSY